MAEREVKVLVAIDKNGDYAASGWLEEGVAAQKMELRDQIEVDANLSAPIKWHWVMAKVPLPEIPEETEIQASKVEVAG